MTTTHPQPTLEPSEATRHSRASRWLSGVGQAVVTVGVLFLLLVVYEVWVTDLVSDHAQAGIAAHLREEWGPAGGGGPASAPDAAPAEALVPPPVGQPFAFIHIPRLGSDYSRAIVEGTDQDQLAGGPGHYIGAAMPGQLGDFAVAGHRVGRGSPFLDLDTLRPGDPIVIETAQTWYVYRVLGDQATGDFRTDPSGIPGQEVVLPTDTAVIAPVPDGARNAVPTRSYLTLTTCNPKFSARTRLIVHAVLAEAPLAKAAHPAGPPALGNP